MAWTEKACEQAENVNPFLSNALPGEARQVFVAHLATCDFCSALLLALREDDRLTRAPLTAAERGQLALIVREARERLSVHLESDKQERERGREGRGVRFGPQFLLSGQSNSWRAVFWAAAAALAAATVVYWLFSR